jgi:pyruvate/2-oxoglutarate dehydrogenase complex dihydrolipoamide dehydrogenase (E3) component/membrane protein DedA with SNARE-associated domain
LLGGALFGLVNGTIIVSIASTIGATLAFLGSRFLLRDWVQSKFGNKLAAINEGIDKEGGFYLFTLRLVPVFPFFAVNLLMGLTKIKTITYAWVSQLGMLPATIVYVLAGTELSKISSLKGIASPGLLGAFAALGLFPLIAKKVLDLIKANKVYQGWKKPAKFDTNMVVIGGGSAGLITALIAAAVKAKVTLVEKNKMGGDCLNTGCVPSKALIKTARIVSQAKHAERYGLDAIDVKMDFAKVMERIQHVIKEIEPHDSVERFTGLGVDCLQGAATIKSPWEVEIALKDGSKKTVTTKNIVIATGAKPFIPPIPGIENTGYFTSDTIWEIREQPKRLLVLGGGPIGSELTQAFARLGSHVTQVEMGSRLLAREDVEVSDLVLRSFLADGVDVRLEHKALRFEAEGGEKILIAEHRGSEVKIAFDMLMCAVGRSARVTGFGLETLGIGLSKTRTVEINDRLQTKYPNIFAAGDVAGPYQFTHTAAHMAWYAAVNGLFGKFKSFPVDYRVVPWATFTEPECARVGINEQEAKQQGIAYEVSSYGIDDLDRAIADAVAHGFVKVLTVPGKDKILGVTIVGEHAGDLIAEFVAAMKHGYGLNKILGTIHIYPTLAESNKMVAGVWKKAHAPQGLLKWVEKFHQWQRG